MSISPKARRLDIGCGLRKRPGFVGLDRSRTSGADVRCDLERGLPFLDDTFDEVWMSHVFEHLDDTVGMMDDIWRVMRAGGTVELRGPHFSSPYLVWGDPTHRRGLSLSTFRCFTRECAWYVSSARFVIESCELVKGDTEFGAVSLKPWYWPFVLWNKAWSSLINVSQPMVSRYERLLARFIGFQEIRVVMTAVKDPQSCGRKLPGPDADV
jgi:hypothetical protein